MSTEAPQALPDPAPLGWSAERRAVALAVAAPNDRRIAAAAAERLTLDDQAATFAAWCDGQAAPDAEHHTAAGTR